MAFSTSSTITSIPGSMPVPGNVYGAHQVIKVSNYHGDHISHDQRTFDEMTDDESSLPPKKSVVGFKTLMVQMNKHFLCHPFWSWCFDDDDKEELIVAAEKPQECANSLVSFQGSANLEEWQHQRREKMALLGLSYSDDDPVDILNREEDSQKSDTYEDVDLNIQKHETPATITVAKASASDKYMSVKDPTYKVEDDVASEVSLDFPEPNQGIKGQLIKIKKQPPNTITTQKKKPIKGENATGKKSKTSTDHSSKSQDTETEQKSNEKKEKQVKNDVSQNRKHDKGREESQIALLNQKSTENSNIQDTTVRESDKQLAAVNEDSNRSLNKASKKEEGTMHNPTAQREKQESQCDKQGNVHFPNSTHLTLENTESNPSHDPTKKSTKRVSLPESRGTVSVGTIRTREPQSQVVDDDLELSSILPSPRFIPDFSRRELKLRPTTSPAEQLRWKYAEDSRWEYYGDPRRNRVDYWWKEESRSRFEEHTNYANRAEQDRDLCHSEERYQCDSHSEDGSYFNKHASGPSLGTAGGAKERVEQLARECGKQQKSTVFQLFGFGTRPYEPTRGTRSDELDDFAEVNDLGVLPGSRHDMSQINHDESRDPAVDLPRGYPGDPSMYEATYMTPVPPGVFHL
jgi:hypothetical protein